jgi:NitT/TauT family transport system substrate-binding protein
LRSLKTLAMAAALAFAAPALAADKVSVATVGNSSDAGFFIADANGHFRAEGLEVTFIPFDTAQRMLPSLGKGELDVGSGTASASLYNAAARDLGMKIVADRSRTERGNMFQTLMIRKALVDSGRYRTYADLKGLKMALLAPGGSPSSTLNEAAKKGGHAFSDMETVFIGFPQQVAAFHNGAIDGSIMIEPFATAIVNAGDAARVVSTEDFYPDDQIGMVFFSEKFITERRDIGLRFMKAYVRALRDYNDGLKDGKFAPGPKGEALVAIMAKGLGAPPEQIRGAYVQALDPDGKPAVESLRKDLEFFKAQGFVTDRSVGVDKVLDLTLVERAVKDLGPYVPRRD